MLILNCLNNRDVTTQCCWKNRAPPLTHPFSRMGPLLEKRRGIWFPPLSRDTCQGEVPLKGAAGQVGGVNNNNF